MPSELTDDQKHACIRDMIVDQPENLANFLLAHEKDIKELQLKHNALTELAHTDGNLIAEYNTRIEALEKNQERIATILKSYELISTGALGEITGKGYEWAYERVKHLNIEELATKKKLAELKEYNKTLWKYLEGELTSIWQSEVNSKLKEVEQKIEALNKVSCERALKREKLESVLTKTLKAIHIERRDQTKFSPLHWFTLRSEIDRELSGTPAGSARQTETCEGCKHSFIDGNRQKCRLSGGWVKNEGKCPYKETSQDEPEVEMPIPADDIKQSILYVKGQCDGYEEAAREILADLKEINKDCRTKEFLQPYPIIIKKIEKWEARLQK